MSKRNKMIVFAIIVSIIVGGSIMCWSSWNCVVLMLDELFD